MNLAEKIPLQKNISHAGSVNGNIFLLLEMIYFLVRFCFQKALLKFLHDGPDGNATSSQSQR